MCYEKQKKNLYRYFFPVVHHNFVFACFYMMCFVLFLDFYSQLLQDALIPILHYITVHYYRAHSMSSLILFIWMFPTLLPHNGLSINNWNDFSKPTVDNRNQLEESQCSRSPNAHIYRLLISDQREKVVLQSQKVPSKLLLAACSRVNATTGGGGDWSSLMLEEGIYVILFIPLALQTGQYYQTSFN